VEENQDRIYRLKPRENLQINKWWMCDEGRFGWKYVHAAERVREPQRRVKGERVNVEWSQIPDELDAQLSRGGKLAAVLSPFLTVEEAYLLARYLRERDSQTVLAVGFVPVVGQDESFPGGFTIRAEKCPNRRGVEEVVRHFMGEVVSWDDFRQKMLASESFDAVWVTGGYPQAWHGEELAEQFAGIPTLIVQDCFESPLWRRAEWQLPGATFAERAGSFVNSLNRLQSFHWAIRSPAGVMVEAQLYWPLLRRPGLYQAPRVLQEMAREIPFFRAAADGVPAEGVELSAAEAVAAEST
jgi:NADH-quinone oxidoreductase subunit G